MLIKQDCCLLVTKKLQSTYILKLHITLHIQGHVNWNKAGTEGGIAGARGPGMADMAFNMYKGESFAKIH